MSADHLLAHRHGGDPSGTGLQPGVLDFSVNISPLPLPLPDLPLSSFALGSYPSVDGRAISAFYASRFGIDEAGILALNGAIEGIYLLPRALGLKRVLIPRPSFFDYSRACRLSGAEVVPLQLDAAGGFAFPDIDTVSNALEGCDALFAGRPNNPTGTMIPKELLLELSRRFPGKAVIVDEAFIQYTDGFPSNSLMPDAMAIRNLCVLHSLTKFYALPGLRLGAVVAHPETIARLYAHKEPWTVNAVAEAVAGHMAGFGGYEAEVRRMVAAGRRQMAAALGEHPAFSLSGGAANFFFATMRPGHDLDALLAFLGRRGIMVRDCRNFTGLDAPCFRFAVRTPGENSRLIEAFDAFAGEVAA